MRVAGIFSLKPKENNDDINFAYTEAINLVKYYFNEINKGNVLFNKKATVKVVDNLLKLISNNTSELIRIVHETKQCHYIYSHSINVSVMSMNLAFNFGHSVDDIRKLGIIGILHDIGMVKKWSLAMLRRRLSDKEHYEVRKHVNISVDILNLMGLEELANIIVCEHERIDGSGYPLGLRGNNINNMAKIIGIVDVYEALSHDRPFRKGLSPHSAIKTILTRERLKFDIPYIKALVDNISLYPPGTIVRLNGGRIAKVVAVNKYAPTRPIVQLCYKNEKTINLSEVPMLYIRSAVE